MTDWNMSTSTNCEPEAESVEETQKIISQMSHQLHDLVYM